MKGMHVSTTDERPENEPEDNEPTAGPDMTLPPHSNDYADEQSDEQSDYEPVPAEPAEDDEQDDDDDDDESRPE